MTDLVVCLNLKRHCNHSGLEEKAQSTIVGVPKKGGRVLQGSMMSARVLSKVCYPDSAGDLIRLCPEAPGMRDEQHLDGVRTWGSSSRSAKWPGACRSCIILPRTRLKVLGLSAPFLSAE